ncbi:hypothetical protein [Advenella sp. S44]|uniref:hypothetical protein n=1 Tax=Advenella sp. S44 TaxID=1982755 RepID=UPI00128FDB58|nr:hypothetical protein [Advenella sp. S44]
MKLQKNTYEQLNTNSPYLPNDSADEPLRVESDIDPLPVLQARTFDDDGKTLIKWKCPVAEGIDSVKIYARVTNDPETAIVIANITSNSESEGLYTHNRHKKPCWYWVTVLYSNGQESEKKFAGSQER